jgi:thiamine-phosphate pyrophosphorylase
LKLRLPKIYPITHTAVSGLSHLEQVERLVCGGAKLIQLREKKASPRDFYAAAAAAIAFARLRDVKIIINDRVDIAAALDADGVHLGQDDLPPEHARELLGPNAIIGFSSHSLDQAIAASRLPVDYIAIGPIFETTTKPNADPIVGVEGLQAVKAAIGDLPLVAIGGIAGDNINSVLEGAADSAAVISALLTDPEKVAEKLKQMLETVTPTRNHV